MTSTAIDIAGWLGAAGVVLAYALISAGRVRADETRYQLLNLFGSAAVIANSIWYHAYPSAFINFVWIGIALAALVGIFRSRSRQNPGS